ncbi:MAG TPA: caspase family protein [Herpetosiphonaceae bacterium]|nr:caspase family protein [Herpetosiphonaceae bacterium]
MAPPFVPLMIADFALALDRFPFTREINEVHLHHTGRPSQDEYRGQNTLVAIWRYHTEQQQWGDIAQHITVAPDGTIWSGRNWDQPPVSAAGHNGNRRRGPFVVTLIGNFDHGADRFQDQQRTNALTVIALVQRRFGLTPETLRFHNQLSMRTSRCPGDSIDYAEIVAELRQLHTTSLQSAARKRGGPFDDEAQAGRDLIDTFVRSRPSKDDPPHAEPDDDTMTNGDWQSLFSDQAGTRSARLGQRAARLTPEAINFLRPYVVNLTLGEFSEAGVMKTTQADVDSIFDTHLARALDGAKASRERLRIVFWAHGGLVNETNGLLLAEKHVRWWRSNNIYPIYFVWETGLFETIGQLLRSSRQAVRRATRDIFDYTTDPVIEGLVRALYAPRIWSGMKRSAELAVATDGGARYVATRLKAFCDAHPDEVELHAAGHSAGSIFQSHFLPAALELKVPAFRTTHFLAPAIRVDTFQNQLARFLGNGIEHLTIFTMSSSRERDDDCAGIYRKSLLYLIYHALERDPKTPILGLEDSLRKDRRLADQFGLGPTASKTGEVVWSDTTLLTGRSASTAIHHGDFDNDPSTMNSIVRRILGADDNDPIVDFPPDVAGGRNLSSWDYQVDWPEEVDMLFDEVQAPPATPAPAPPPVTPVPSTGSAAAPPYVQPIATGRRRALCVGINEYQAAPLYGCVADARQWESTLRTLGFDEIELLVDRQATRDAILQALRRMVTSSASGDIVVFQYAGHGTQLPDTSRDEKDGDTPANDEAICPIDYLDGAFVIDDDLGAIFDQITPGVNITCFIDCCHSGTISRFGVGAPPAGGNGAIGLRPRFIVANEQMKDAHRRFRQAAPARRSRSLRGLTEMPEVLFAACLSSEVAYEEGGHGDFTTRATQLLQAGLASLTNEQFEQQVTSRFGTSPRQHPRLYCAPAARSRALLGAVGSAQGATILSAGRTLGTGGNGVVEPTVAAQLLRIAASLIDGRS